MVNIIRKKRTADSPIYIKDNSYKKPKEMFKFIERLSFKDKDKKFKCLDVGCAGGNFLYFLKEKNPKSEFYGMDPVKDLIQKSITNVPNCRFYKKSALMKNSWNSKIFDKIFMVGVHPIFDDFTIPLKNMIKWTKSKGEIYICDMFNPYPVDVFIYYRMAENIKNNKLERGWNNFSMKSFTDFLNSEKRVKSFSFTKFDMSFDLKKQKDPVRSWTIKEVGKKRLMINGLGLVQNQCLLKIKLN